jgi:hypothetical protein
MAAELLRDVAIGVKSYLYGNRNISIHYVKTGPTHMFASASDVLDVLSGDGMSHKLEHIQGVRAHSLQELMQQVALSILATV